MSQRKSLAEQLEALGKLGDLTDAGRCCADLHEQLSRVREGLQAFVEGKIAPRVPMP